MSMKDEIEQARKKAATSITRLAREIMEKLDEEKIENNLDSRRFDAEADARNMSVVLRAILELGAEDIEGIHAMARGAIRAHERRTNLNEMSDLS
jgi:hypothetical protein